MHARHALLALLVGGPIGWLLAAEPRAYLDSATAGPEFAVQGEYASEATDNANQPKFGAQVIAEGAGKFSIRLLAGGLPGAGWDTRTERRGTVVSENGKWIVQGKDFSGEITDGRLILRGSDLDTSLRRVERQSPTLGMKPPEGAVILFDGSSADAWVGGRVVENQYLNVGVKSKAKFRDFTLHLEFRLPYMPRARGQGRGNSGLYLQDRYELQILDSFGLKGLNNECGGFYQAAAPAVNMCLPPLQWQTYDIDFKAARFEQGKKVSNAIVTVKHNGVVIHDRLELAKPTPGGSREDDTPGPFQLQNHNDPVVFRNIWVIEK